MKLFHRKSKLEKLIESLESSELLKTTARTAVESAVASKASPRDAQKLSNAIDALELDKPRKSGSFRRKVKTGFALTAGAAALVAASATVSSMRGKEGSA